jgi:hypothetical protein
MRDLSRSVIQLRFRLGGKGSACDFDLGKVNPGRAPRVTILFIYFRSRRTTSNPIESKLVERRSFAAALFVCAIRLSLPLIVPAGPFKITALSPPTIAWIDPLELYDSRPGAINQTCVLYRPEREYTTRLSGVQRGQRPACFSFDREYHRSRETKKHI